MGSLSNQMPFLASHKRLTELYSYDPLTGILTRRQYCGRGFPGQVITGDLLSINYRRVTKGRVIWCIFYGEWPPANMVVDHINRDHNDNRICNLRLATKSQNGFNVNYREGKGVHKVSDNTWAARININGRQTHLGCFPSYEEAKEAYIEAARETQGEFVCHL